MEEALEKCYIAVSEPGSWGEALDTFANSLGASGAMFYPKDVNAGASLVPFSSSYGELLEEYLAGRWYEGHYRAQRGWPLLKQTGRTFITEHDLATADERKRLPHYKELYLRFWFVGFAAIGFKLGDQDLCLPLLRSAKQGHFSQEDVRAYVPLRNHLTRLMRPTDVVQRTGNRVALQVFDNSGKAALVIGDDGRVIAMNDIAGRLLDVISDHLKIVNSRLVCTNGAYNKALAHLVKSGTATKANWRSPPDPIGLKNQLNWFAPLRALLAKNLPVSRDYSLTRSHLVAALNSGIIEAWIMSIHKPC